MYLHCGDRYAGPDHPEKVAYFKRLNEVPLTALAKFFLERDISNFNSRAIPACRDAQIQIEKSMKPVHQWFNEMLKEGSMEIIAWDYEGGGIIGNPKERGFSKNIDVAFANKKIYKRWRQTQIG